MPKDILIPYTKNLKFDAITSNDGLKFERLDNVGNVNKNKDYLNLKFYFRTINHRYTEIHLANHKTNVAYNEVSEGTYITSEGRNFENKVDYYYSEDEFIKSGTVKKYFAKDAMRLSFNSNDLESAKIFDLSGNEERGFGYMYGAHSFYEAKEGIKLTPPKSPKTIYEMSEFSNKDPIALTDTSYLLSLKNNNEGYYTGELEMNIWLEGWDADAFDAIFKDILKIQLEFKAVMPNYLFE